MKVGEEIRDECKDLEQERSTHYRCNRRIKPVKHFPVATVDIEAPKIAM